MDAIKHAKFVQGLRDAADFFEARPQLGVPYEGTSFKIYSAVDGVSIDSKEGLARFYRIVGGRIDKSEDDTFYRLTADRGSFSVMATAYRTAVCEKVQVGVKVEEGHVVSAQPAQVEQYVPAREIPIYAWRCPSLLQKPAVEIEGEVGELESGTDPATLQLEAGLATVGGGQDDDDALPPF